MKYFGTVGQEKLCQSKVLCIGTGGLGCPAAAAIWSKEIIDQKQEVWKKNF